jgi:hypothetical protein
MLKLSGTHQLLVYVVVNLLSGITLKKYKAILLASEECGLDFNAEKIYVHVS